MRLGPRPAPSRHPSVNAPADLPAGAPYRLGGPAPPDLPPCVPPSLVTAVAGTGLLARCPSPTPRGLGLGPPHPQLISMAAGPSGIRWGGFAPPSRYSCRHSHSPPLQARFRSPFSADGDAPLPRAIRRIRGFGAGLSPGGLSAPRHVRPVSYYALFQGWLLLSQPPGCRRAATALPTEPGLGGLSRRSGLFPSRPRNFAPAVSLPRDRAAAFGVWFGLVSGKPPRRSGHATSAAPSPGGGTQMPFGENQLSPGSLGISPLPTGHPCALQRARVRASTGVFRPLRPAHGWLTRFRVGSTRLASPLAGALVALSDSRSLRLRLSPP